MRLLFGLLRAAFRLLFYPFVVLAWKRAARPGSYVMLEIDGAVTDIRKPPSFFDRFRPKPPPISLYGLGELVTAIAADPRIRGMIVTLRSVRAGAAAAWAIRQHLKRARDAGRDVVVHLPFGGSTQAIFIATGGSRILAGPTTTLAPLGYMVQSRYLRGALDKASVVPEVYSRGRYKSAGEEIARTDMSEAQREQLSAILDQRYEALLDAVSEGRKIDVDRARALVDGAPYQPEEAIAAGLIDGAAYDDQVIPFVKGDAKEGADPLPTVEALGYLAARRALSIPRVRPEPVVGVIQVHGAIAMDGLLPAQLGMATDEALISMVRSARRNPKVRGVLLHIDSPGGSALASDRIHHELELLAQDKPLVACMANVAASGGYYVAAPAHLIVAQPATITGSIGVVATRLVFDPLLERLGVATEVLKRGLRADLISPTRALTDEEKAVIEREIEAFYRTFLRVVASGRKLSMERAEAVAEGRVWTGTDAKRVGLVDELGGFEAALSAVRSKIGAGADRMKPALLQPPRHHSPLVYEEPKKKATALYSRAAELLATAGLDLGAAALALSGERVLALYQPPILLD